MFGAGRRSRNVPSIEHKCSGVSRLFQRQYIHRSDSFRFPLDYYYMTACGMADAKCRFIKFHFFLTQRWCISGGDSVCFKPIISHGGILRSCIFDCSQPYSWFSRWCSRSRQRSQQSLQSWSLSSSSIRCVGIISIVLMTSLAKGAFVSLLKRVHVLSTAVIRTALRIPALDIRQYFPVFPPRRAALSEMTGTVWR